MKTTANKRPGVDAGWRVLFAFQRAWPRATQAGGSPMKTLIWVAVLVIGLSRALGAQPSREEVSRAIAQVETNVVSASAVDAANIILDFAEESEDVMISITTNTVPWLKEKWGLGAEMEQTIRSMLLAAYVAGNTKSQLAAGKPKDDPYAGWVFVCRAYAKFRTKISFASPSIDSLERRHKEGSLRRYAQDVLKKGEPPSAADRSQPVRPATNSTPLSAGSGR